MYREPNPPLKWKNQDKIKLTKEDLEEADPNSVIDKGKCYIEHYWFNQAKKKDEGGNLEDDNRSVLVKYVLYRGGVADWCIYHSLNANLTRSDNLQSPEHLDASFEKVMKYGGKVTNEEVIKSIVDCSEEVFKQYRY